MAFTTPRDQLVDKVTELVVRHDIRLLVIDGDEQLNLSGIAFLCALSGKTSCRLLLIGNERLLRMRVYLSASAPFALLERFARFWSRRNKNNV